MLNFTITADPSTADTALEMLQHIEKALQVMAKGAAKVATDVAAKTTPKPAAVEKTETLAPADTKPAEKKPATKKPAAKKAADKEETPPVGLGEMSDADLLTECREAVKSAKDVLGVRAVVDTLRSFSGARQLDQLDRGGRIAFIDAINLQISEAKA